MPNDFLDMLKNPIDPAFNNRLKLRPQSKALDNVIHKLGQDSSVRNTAVATWMKPIIEPCYDSGPIRYAAQLIIQTEDDPAVRRATSRLAAKHSENSIVVQLDAAGHYQVVHGDISKLRLDQTDQTGKQPKVRWQVVGHGRTAPDGNRTMGGLAADEMAWQLSGLMEELATQQGVKSPPARISLVGCSLGASLEQESFGRSLVSALKAPDTEISVRTADVAVDTQGRKHTQGKDKLWVHKAAENKRVFKWQNLESTVTELETIDSRLLVGQDKIDISQLSDNLHEKNLSTMHLSGGEQDALSQFFPDQKGKLDQDKLRKTIENPAQYTQFQAAIAEKQAATLESLGDLEELTINTVQVPEEAKPALFAAYEKDVNAMDDVALLAHNLGITINIYKAPVAHETLKTVLKNSEQQKLTSEQTSELIDDKQDFGNGLPVIDIVYSQDKQRYEIITAKDDHFVRLGHAGDDAESLYHCLANSAVPINGEQGRVDQYKRRLTQIKDTSYANIGAMLKKNTLPGEKTKNALHNIAMDRQKSIENVQKVMQQLYEEYWDNNLSYKRDQLGTDIGDYLARNKNILLKTEPKIMNAAGTGYHKLHDLTQKEIDSLYAKLQNDRINILQYGYKDANEWQTQAVYKKKFIKGDADYQAMALSALLNNVTKIENEEFRQAIALITNINPEKLKKAYQRIHGSADLNKLEADIKKAFYVEGESSNDYNKYFRRGEGHKLQFPYLKQVLNNGKESPEGRLALKLGLLYKGVEFNKLTSEQKDEILTLIKENPGELAALADIDEQGNLADSANKNLLLQRVYADLKAHHSGSLGEIQASLKKPENTIINSPQTIEVITENVVETIEEDGTVNKFLDSTIAFSSVTIAETLHDSAAKSLIALLYNEDKQQLRRLGKPSFIGDSKPAEKKIIEWMKECSQAELEHFIAARTGEQSSKIPTLYHRAWELIAQQMAISPNTNFHKTLVSMVVGTPINDDKPIIIGDWKGYFCDMAKAQLDIGDNPQDVRAFYEVEAFLKYQKSRGGLLSYKEQKATLAKVMNMLSARGDWDPKAKLTTFIQNHPDISIAPQTEKHHGYTKEPIQWLNDLLQAAGVNAEGREQINLLLDVGGTYNGEEATNPTLSIDNYLRLKRKAHRRHIDTSTLADIRINIGILRGEIRSKEDIKKNREFNELSKKNILTSLSEVKPGSLEHWVLREDQKLLTEIHEAIISESDRSGIVWNSIYNILDLPLEWKDPRSLSTSSSTGILNKPSEDDLKAFEEKYKDDVAKKKIWQAKYLLARNLTKEQSFFNSSGKVELLKVVYAGQLEGYRGKDLIQILDNIDPGIRKSLVKEPKTNWTKHEKTAHTLLQKFLIQDKPIDFKDFLGVADGKTSNDYNILKFAAKKLPPERAVTLWCSKSYNELQQWSADRLVKTLKLHMMEADTTKTAHLTQDKLKLETEIAQLDEKISKHQFEIDDERKAQLKKLTRGNKTAELERQIKQKIGETLLNQPEKFPDLHIPPLELLHKGTILLAEADIDYQHYLNTGVGYHRFSVAGLESYAEVSHFMQTLWKTNTAQLTGSTPEERAKQENQLFKDFKKSHDDLLQSLDHWKDNQDTYTKRIVDIVDKAVSTALTIALAATGAGAVALAIIAPMKAALTAALKTTVQSALSRSGDVLPQEILKNALVSASASIPGILASVDYGDVPGLKKIIDNPIGFKLMKGQITSISKATLGGIGNIVVASGSGNFEMSSKAFQDDFIKNLQDYNLTQPKIYKTALTGLSAGLSKLVSDGIQLGISGKDAKAFKKLSDDEQKKLNIKIKPLQKLYEEIYNNSMKIKGYDLLAAGPVALANLPFADDPEQMDANFTDLPRKKITIANAIVETLAEKGLRVDKDFDYNDPKKLIEQIAEKMPGVALTPEEIQELSEKVDAAYDHKMFDNIQSNLTEGERKQLLLDGEKERLLTSKKADWVSQLQVMEQQLEQKYDTIKEQAEQQAEQVSKQLAEDIQASKDGDVMQQTLKTPSLPDKPSLSINTAALNNHKNNVVPYIASQFEPETPEQQTNAERKKKKDQLRRRRETKKQAA